MGNKNKTNFFLRISHLIMIQIFFIFAALALVFFYPQENGNEREIFMKQLDAMFIPQLDSILPILENGSDFSTARFDTLMAVDRYFMRNSQFISLDLIYFDSAQNQSVMGHLAGVSEKNIDNNIELIRRFGHLSGNNLDGEYLPAIKSFSGDGKYIHYIFSFAAENNDYVLIFRANNFDYEIPRRDLAYLLILLFLISTLISLLIIYLIKRNLEYPLQKIISGYGRTNSANHVDVPATGDASIVRLNQAFNQMSRSLKHKQNELESANRQLIKTNRSIAESEAILTALVDYSPDAIIVTDLDSRVILYNYQAAEDFGFERVDMNGIFINELIQVAPENWRDIVIQPEMPVMSTEIICRHRNETHFPALMIRTVLGISGDPPMAILHFIKNISESASYREMILKLDRTAARGRMARDIAHEINNYLAILQGNLELAPMFVKNKDFDKLGSRLDLMKETVDRIANFTEGLTRFSEEQTTFTREDLNQLIENLVAFLKPQNKYDHVSIETRLCDNLQLVEIDAGQFQLLLVNLISNAAEALVDRPTRDGRIEIVTAFDSDKTVTVKIRDNGDGIDDKNLKALFVKRFSTKRDGTGVGLITCKNIVANHGGRIEYRRTEDNFSVFDIRLPVSRKLQKINSNSHPSRPVIGV